MNSDPCALHIQGFTHRLTGAQTGNNYFSSLSLVQANEKLAWSPNIALSVHYAPLWSTESKSSESEEVPGINLWFVNKCTCSGVETSHILILQVYLISTEKNNQHNQLIHISPQLLLFDIADFCIPPNLFHIYAFPFPGFSIFFLKKKSERPWTIHKRALCKFTIGCFIIVSQGLSRGAHLVTGCLAMAMLLRPVRKTAKSFRWNRQVQKIRSPSHTTLS